MKLRRTLSFNSYLLIRSTSHQLLPLGGIVRTPRFTSSLFLFALLLCPIFSVPKNAYAYQSGRTWYVNNVTGSDGNDGRSQELDSPGRGPKRTLTGTLPLTADGDRIVLVSTNQPYGAGSGEGAIIQIKDRAVSIAAAGGEVILESGLEINNDAGSSVRAVRFEGSGIRIQGGLWLMAGDVEVVRGSIILMNMVTRGKGRLQGAPNFVGPIDYYYNLTVPTLIGDEFPSDTTGVIVRNVVISGLFPLTTSRSLTVHGDFVLRSDLNLAGHTLRFVPGESSRVYRIQRSVSNGSIECVVGDTMVVDAQFSMLPDLVARSRRRGSSAHLIVRANAVGGVRLLDEVTATLQFSGVSSLAQPNVTGSILHASTGRLQLDRTSPGVLYVKGNITLQGSGTIEVPATPATGILVEGDVVLSTTIHLQGGEVVEGRGVIRFGNIRTTVTGTVRNAVTIDATTLAGRCDSSGLILFDVQNNGLFLGRLVNDARIVNDIRSPDAIPVRSSGNIVIRFVGDQGGSVVVGSIRHGGRLENRGSFAPKSTLLGTISFPNPVVGPLEIGDLTNSTELIGPFDPRMTGSIVMSAEAQGEVVVRSILSAGNRGGIIQLSANSLLVEGDIRNERTMPGADLSLNLVGRDARLVVGGSLAVVGASNVHLSSRTPSVTRFDKNLFIGGPGSLLLTANALLPPFQGLIPHIGNQVVPSQQSGIGREDPSLADTLMIRGDLILEGGAIDFGSKDVILMVRGALVYFEGGPAGIELRRGEKSTLWFSPHLGGFIEQTVQFAGREVTLPGKLIVGGGVGSLGNVRMRGLNARVKGSLQFGDTQGAPLVILDGLRLFVEGREGVTNYSGYRSERAGCLVLTGSASMLGGGGMFSELEVAVDDAVTISENVGLFTGSFVLTRGAVRGSQFIRLREVSSPLWIVRRKGQFDAAPSFLSPVNVLYEGGTTAASFELPSDSTKLNDLIVRFPWDRSEDRTTVVLARPVTVRGRIRIDTDQVLALQRSVDLMMSGADMVVDGALVVPRREAGSLVISSQQGLTITGQGYLPSLSVVTENATHRVHGIKALIEGLYGDDLMVGTSDDLVLSAISEANGDIRIFGGRNHIELGFGAGVGTRRSHVRHVFDGGRMNTMNLKSALTVSGSWRWSEGPIDVEISTLTFLGPEIEMRDSRIESSGGKTVFWSRSSTTRVISEVLSVPGLPIQLKTAAAHGWSRGQVVSLDGWGNQGVLKDGVYRVFSVPTDESMTLETLAGEPLLGEGRSISARGRVSSIQLMNLSKGLINRSEFNSVLQMQGDDTSSRLVLFGPGSGAELVVNGTFIGQDVHVSVGVSGNTVDFFLKSDSAFFGRNLGLTGDGAIVIQRDAPSRWFLADTVRLGNLFVQGDIELHQTNGVILVEGRITHDHGTVSLSDATLIISGYYKHLAGSIRSTNGIVVLRNATVEVSSNGLNIPVVRMEGQATTVMGEGVLMIQRLFEIDVVGRAEIGSSSGSHIAVAPEAEVRYRGGMLSTSPRYSPPLKLTLVPRTSITVPQTVWPSEPLSLVSVLTIGAERRSDTLLIPGFRTVWSRIRLKSGFLDVRNPENRIKLSPGGILERSDEAGLLVSSLTLGAGLLGDSISVHYVRTSRDTLIMGAELPQRARGLSISAGGEAGTGITVLTRPVVILDSLILENSIRIVRGAVLAVEGDVAIRNVPFQPREQNPLCLFEEPLQFVGGKEQLLRVPTAGMTIGSIQLDKVGTGVGVNLIGGNLNLANDAIIIFRNGLLRTGQHTVRLNNPLGVGTGADQGFLRVVGPGQRSHIVGSVRKNLKVGSTPASGRTEFPVGSNQNYRPLALVLLQSTTGFPAGDMGVSLVVSHHDEMPVGVAGLPIPNGIAPNVPLTGLVPFYWRIEADRDLGAIPFVLSLTAAGASSAEVPLNEVLNNRVKIVRRDGPTDATRNLWALVGSEYDNYVINDEPTVVAVNARGGLLKEGALFTYGLKRSLFIQNPLVPPGRDIVISSTSRDTVIDLEGDRPLIGGRVGMLSYQVTVSNVSVVVASIVDRSKLLLRVQSSSGIARVRLIANDQDGSTITYEFSVRIDSPTGVEEEVVRPTEFSLSQNYPNPFNPSTTIRFGLPKEAPVTLEIYNVLGVKVRTLIAGETMNAALHSVVWDGKDDAGVAVPSGVYLYRIYADQFQASKKMTLIK